MYTNSNIHLIDIPIGGNGELVWNRLHSEREDICEEVLRSSESTYGAEGEIDSPSSVSTRTWHQELLQARLRMIDDALDRLMSGSYGHCSKCGEWIGDTELDLDPARSKCLVCSQRQEQNGVGNSTQEFIRVTDSNQRVSAADTN